MARSPKRRRSLRRFSVLRLLLLLAVYGLSLAAAGAYFAVVTVNRDLPADLSALLEYQPSRKSLVFSADGEKVGQFALENRKIVALERMPPHLPAAFLSAEDRRFYQHGGFDVIGIARAAIKNFRADGVKQGGSTLTQQIIKQTLLANEEAINTDGLTASEIAQAKKRAKYQRKIKELILAVRVERELSKAEILSIYLNHVFLGRAYGVAAAAEVFFGKDVENLTIAESALLAGLVASPSTYAPTANMALARERQLYVLGHMVEDGYISLTQYLEAKAEPLALIGESDINKIASPSFVEHLRRTAQDRYSAERVFHGGLRFYTTVDTRLQAIAESAVHNGLQNLDHRLGFRGPIGHLDEKTRAEWTKPRALGSAEGLSESVPAESLQPATRYAAVVKELTRGGGLLIELGASTLPVVDVDAKAIRAWRSPTDKKTAVAVGDILPVTLNSEATAVVLTQRPNVQAAMVVLDQHTGRVVAMVGGFDWASSQFNRATQARRQVGSSIKPFIYGAAIAAGRTVVDVMVDGPQAVPTATGIWSPSNYDNKFVGAVTIQNALAQSLNTISVQFVVAVGVDRIIEIMRGFGITSAIPRHVSLALGTPDITLLEMAAGYAGIAVGGRRVTPRFFDLVTDSDGNIVDDFRTAKPGQQVFSPEAAYVLTYLMKGVVSRGTAKGALVLGRPAAGKTGTSANFRDVWFIGFTNDLLAAVWIGRDDSTPIGDKITGGGAAVPIWVDFMTKGHPATPVKDFPVPPGITFERGDPWSGNPTGPSPNAQWLPFVRGTVPKRFLTNRTIRSFDDVTPAPPVR
ncbi:MAG: PBP1A family penicillin-binding protein [Kofleriaceae bacterium]|nr:PBP1A family penicillin-binding protein [Kofleriaceae bacterium]